MKILCVASLFLAAVVAATATGGSDDCIVTMDFSKLPNGTKLQGGAYLGNEWQNDYGLVLSVSGGLYDKPRLFDTSKPGTNKYGDRDLGSPNERCKNPGPGRGEGGEPDGKGPNCPDEPLGQVLIIQEDNDNPEIPDDNVNGGVISFHFNKPLRVAKIGLLDIDYKSFLTVTTTSESGQQTTTDVDIPMLGDNSLQTLEIDTGNVSQLDLNLARSGAVTFLSFCYTDDDGPLGRVDEACFEDDDCETGFCWANWPIASDQPGVCRCSTDTNQGCPQGKLCVNPLLPGTAPSCFLPIGAACSNDDDCFSGKCNDKACAACDDETDYPCDPDQTCSFDSEDGYFCETTCEPGGGCGGTPVSKIGDPCSDDAHCETNYCAEPWGRCTCNLNTNAGCEDDPETECTVSAYSIAWSSYREPACYLPIGATCASDSECASVHCDDNKCVCNPIWNGFPCSELDQVCTFREEDGFQCRCKIGEPCCDRCEADYCFNAILPDGTRPVGVCSCNPITNEGCGDPNDECAFSPFIDIAPPDCYRPFGKACSVDAECLTNKCSKEVCMCNPNLNFPCLHDTVCAYIGDDVYICQDPLQIGEPCLSHNACETGFCYALWVPGSDDPGECWCNPSTHAGCSEGKSCLYSGLPGGAPFCSLPTGADCLDDDDCLSDNCYENACAECDDETNYPCRNPDQVCSPDEEFGFACRDREIGDACESEDDCLDDLVCAYHEGDDMLICQEPLQTDAPCVFHSSCETDFCWFGVPNSDNPGKCKCNPETNAGCPQGRSCLYTGIPGGAPICSVPAGARCSNDAECPSRNCYKNACAACDDQTNYPCNENQACLFDKDFGFACRDVLGEAGDPCESDDDCGPDFFCWKEYRPLSPGICSCTQSGCFGRDECASSPFKFNAQPKCYPGISGCLSDDDCISDHCYNGQCVCNEFSDYPCADDETCIFDEDELLPGYVCSKLECIDPHPDENCPNLRKPVKCFDGCEYTNICWALSSEYASDECRYSNDLKAFELGSGGNLYKAFEIPEIPWEQANGAAGALADWCGVDAHLATITSSEEDEFVHQLGRQIHYYAGRARGFWVGGFQNLSSPYYKEPGGAWQWLNGEGRIPTPTQPLSGYSNWAPNEPNDKGRSNEQYMTVNTFDENYRDEELKGYNATGWNDEVLLYFVRGYIVEVEADETVLVNGCDSKVKNSRLPPFKKDCPPGQISSLMDGCMEYNDPTKHPDEFRQCVGYIAVTLRNDGIITAPETIKLIDCAFSTTGR